MSRTWGATKKRVFFLALFSMETNMVKQREMSSSDSGDDGDVDAMYVLYMRVVPRGGREGDDGPEFVTCLARAIAMVHWGMTRAAPSMGAPMSPAIPPPNAMNVCPLAERAWESTSAAAESDRQVRTVPVSEIGHYWRRWSQRCQCETHPSDRSSQSR